MHSLREDHMCIYIHIWGKDRYFGMIQVPPCPKAFGHLGSSPPDDFSYYLICPNMWRAIDSIVTHSVPIDPLKRLGLIDSNYENLFTLACCFHAYHAIKHVRNNNPSSLNFSVNIRLFSEAFVTAAHTVKERIKIQLGFR